MHESLVHWSCEFLLMPNVFLLVWHSRGLHTPNPRQTNQRRRSEHSLSWLMSTMSTKSCSILQIHVTRTPEQPEFHFVRAEENTFLFHSVKKRNLFIFVGKSSVAKSFPSPIITDRIGGNNFIALKPGDFWSIYADLHDFDSYGFLLLVFSNIIAPSVCAFDLDVKVCIYLKMGSVSASLWNVWSSRAQTSYS